MYKIVAIILLSIPLHSFAELPHINSSEEEPLTEYDIINIAKNHSPTIRKIRENTLLADYQKIAVASKSRPSIKPISLNTDLLNQTASISTGAKMDFETGTNLEFDYKNDIAMDEDTNLPGQKFKLSVNQPLFKNGQNTRIERNLDKINLEIDYHKREEAEEQFFLKLLKQYRQCIFNQYLIQANQELLKQIDEKLQQKTAEFKHGQISGNEYNQVLSQLQQNTLDTEKSATNTS